ncbi:hypothetical protein [Halorientalis pallida]|uniref:DUF8060 domain-containing protein n=1 Tax=Halorientalis pallida TaxID=2479928 RepID=A0A498L5B2_9EURY|nr:hypothetical protein [Halorientalis pallida]RXK51452.1 hypothetical protein EAF64_02105 [Halorientalis pallida]
MTENTDTTDDAPTADPSPAGSDAPDSVDGEMEIFEQLQWGALVLLIVAAIWATAQFYLSATRAIEVWVGAGYRPVAMAAFNLAVLLGAVAGISRLARRLGSVPT